MLVASLITWLPTPLHRQSSQYLSHPNTLNIKVTEYLYINLSSHSIAHFVRNIMLQFVTNQKQKYKKQIRALNESLTCFP
uniref:Secreted protein n=1 Tax=Heterorhabditis bacteriophora TaxID=37862 RepID=A0A1I7WA50_HETBA